MQLLRVRGVAQEFPQSRRLRAGRPERIEHLLRGQREQPADGVRRGDRSRSSRRVEDLVVRSAQEFADTDADVITSNGCGDQLASGALERLRDRERRRKHDRARMKYRAVVYVVLLGEMRRGGVD